VLIPGAAANLNTATLTDMRPHGLGVELPVAAGAPLAAYTDPITNEVYVAKGGVNGGAWRKARDVLYCRYYRATAFNTTTAVGVLPFDTVIADPYGLYNPTSGIFTVPVAGRYAFYSTATATPTAAGQNFQLYFSHNSPTNQIVYASVSSGGSGAGYRQVPTCRYQDNLSAGDTVYTNQVATAVLPVYPGAPYTYFYADYHGTG
jgi:hypothetical protein